MTVNEYGAGLRQRTPSPIEVLVKSGSTRDLQRQRPGFKLTPYKDNPYNYMPKGAFVSQDTDTVPPPWIGITAADIFKKRPIAEAQLRFGKFKAKFFSYCVRKGTTKAARMSNVHYMMAMVASTPDEYGNLRNLVIGHSTIKYDCLEEVFDANYYASSRGGYMVPKPVIFGIKGGQFILDRQVQIMHNACQKHPSNNRSAVHRKTQQAEMLVQYKYELNQPDSLAAWLNADEPAHAHSKDTGCIVRDIDALAMATADSGRVIYIMLDILKNEMPLEGVSEEECEAFLLKNLGGEEIVDRTQRHQYWRDQFIKLRVGAKLFFIDILGQNRSPLKMEAIFNFSDASPMMKGGDWELTLDESMPKQTSVLSDYKQQQRSLAQSPDSVTYYLKKFKDLDYPRELFTDLYPSGLKPDRKPSYEKTPLLFGVKANAIAATSQLALNCIAPMLNIFPSLFIVFMTVYSLRKSVEHNNAHKLWRCAVTTLDLLCLFIPFALGVELFPNAAPILWDAPRLR